MCCLGYEYNCYVECSKGMPKAGKEVNTAQGKGKIIGVNPLKGLITVDFGDGKIKDIKVCDIKSK